MTIYLCGPTARAYWHDTGIRSHPPLEQPRVRSLAGASASASAVHEGCTAIGMPALEPPFHVLVGSRKAAHASRSVVAHVDSGTFSRSAFVQAASGVRIVSPAFTLMEYAPTASLVQLLMESLELCGTFVTSLDGGPTSYGYPSATSVAAIAAFVAHSSSRRGVKPLRRALRYMVDGAASYAEAALVVLLCLPPAHGGYGFALPVCNQPVDIGNFSLRPDLYWPDHKIGIEYDSAQFHEGDSALARDSSRRAHLGSAGVPIISVTKDQLYDIVEFHTVALALARAMNRRIRFDTSAFREARDALRAEVLGIKPEARQWTVPYMDDGFTPC